VSVSHLKCGELNYDFAKIFRFHYIRFTAKIFPNSTKKKERKTVFVTKDEKYQFKRLFKRLVKAFFYRQKLMNKLMNKSKSSVIFEYFFDILMMKATFENLLINMKLVFEKLRKYDLKCKPNKCKFGNKQNKIIIKQFI